MGHVIRVLVYIRFCFNVFFIFLALFGSACTFERREDFNLSVDTPLRCGIFKSYYFVRDVKEEIYPDLALVLANANRLVLTLAQRQKLEGAARHCSDLCAIEKDDLRHMQEAIKAKLKLNEIHGDLSLLAKDVRAFEKAKSVWLTHHSERYYDGLKILTSGQRALWAPAEDFLKKLPPPKLGSYSF
ncbi:MAG: hypothetical protein LDLANPLL_02194 [Turneriella sp.]|nr:hypothetical protein [Turneriella sp.]